MPPITLYHCPRSRSSMALYMLEEVGVPYEIKMTDVRAREGQKPEYLAINPMGKVPAIKDGNIIVSESGAICLYLADQYPAAKLAPPIGDPRRGPYLKWMFIATSFDAVMVDRMVGRATPPGVRLGYGDYDLILRTLKAGLATGPWLFGDEFTAADAFMAAQINWAMMVKALEPQSPWMEYAERMRARPAFQRAQAKDAG